MHNYDTYTHSRGIEVQWASWLEVLIVEHDNVAAPSPPWWQEECDNLNLSEISLSEGLFIDHAQAIVYQPTHLPISLHVFHSPLKGLAVETSASRRAPTFQSGMLNWRPPYHFPR